MRALGFALRGDATLKTLTEDVVTTSRSRGRTWTAPRSALRSRAPARAGFKRLYLPGYPEGHPAIADAVLADHLTRKLAWCAAHGIEAAVITQFSFDEAAVTAWLARMTAQFPGTRVVIGVAGPAGAATLLRYAALCGVRASMGMLARHPGKLLRVVAETGPDDVVRALAQRELAGAPPAGLHLFSFGGAERTARWCHSAVRGAGSGAAARQRAVKPAQRAA